MGNDGLKIEAFDKLMKSMFEVCDLMPEVLLKEYFDSNKYLFSLYFEAFNSIKGFCILLEKDNLIPQACTVLRMAIERTATVKVLEAHKELLTAYIEHHRFRFETRNAEDKPVLIKEHFKDKCDFKRVSPQAFLEYGWFKTLNGDCSFDALIELSKIQEEDDAIKNWKNELNQWTHGTMGFVNLCSKSENPTFYCHYLILLAAKLLDHLMIDFRKNHGFDFEANGISYREMFLNNYKEASDS